MRTQILCLDDHPGPGGTVEWLRQRGALPSRRPRPLPQLETNQEVTRTLNVSGSGKVYLAPDIAYITIGVHTENNMRFRSRGSQQYASSTVIEALKAAGMDEKDIQTTNFSIYPQQKYDQNGQPTGTIKYIVDNTVFSHRAGYRQIGDLLDAAVKPARTIFMASV